ncbi:MAG: aldehyde ferredoxin oxidoreductase family protein [Anaerolineales bacterium]|nr:aldehyde ferredoxin oxidoreductase family protein [Anaerolineales bacterium]
MQPLLTINLSDSTTGRYEIPKQWETDYLGGASLAARLLYDDLTADLDPLSPEAPLLFLNGPMTGTLGPAVGRYVVCGKSPATGIWAESNCGGFWGVELRKTGYDGIWISGRSPEPVYLWLLDGDLKIIPAGHLWGMETYETRDAVIDEIGVANTRVACIGPAGENKIPFSVIMSDHGRVAGRTGLGAVMGAKNLKAVAVKGNQTIPLHNPEQYNLLRSQTNRELRTDPVSQVMRDLGTAGAADYFDYLMEMPKRYYTRGVSDKEVTISGAHLKSRIFKGISACHGCVIACGRVVDLGDGEKRKGAEFESLAGFGPNLMIDDPVRATQLSELCDRYGLDTISMANTIGLAMLLFDRGIIDTKDTGGIDLRWGNADAVEQLIHQTSSREKLGEYLALGARGFGRQFGSEEMAVQVNGLELAYHDPRGASGMALVHATSPRGACHNQSDYYMVEVGQVLTSLGMAYFSPRAGAEKAFNVVIHQNWRTVFNSLVMCIFANVPPEVVAELINESTGADFSITDLMKIGERGWNLKRAINNKLGLTRENDKLPKGLLEPYEDDPSGYVPDFASMLEAYYNSRDWDPVTGYPSEDKCSELGLDWVLDDLKARKPRAIQ